MTHASHRPIAGILLMVAAAATLAALDTTTRYLGAFIVVTLMLWLRFAMHAAVMATWIGVSADKTFRTANPRFQLLRGTLLFSGSAMAFHGLRYLPVAEWTAIVMTSPLLITLLARVWLKEKVSPLRWLLVAGGLAGTLAIIRPGSGLFGWAVLLPLATAFTNAFFQVLTSRLSPHENPYTTNFYSGIIGTVLAVPFLVASSQHIGATLSAASPLHLALLLSIGLLGTGAHLLLIMALGKAPTATLMPFAYAQIAVATFLGWMALGAAPDAWSWFGIVVIALCGASSAWLNVRDSARQWRPMPQVAPDPVVD
ncbi:DMT family transporter [Ramlibacter sp. 2FC]|uniref:DMT family transporter n=1 Tax=Ramlibacter sp. 2FC TaxID=2502188 RepID=UPI0010F46F30|nr:DMT family transporter [Ramlibacter sp. 2FC]